ncbi:hypothetical protein [Paractinoplanes ferrugineus]|nr:hypothetical protein [Actinoplanes ferrugineus]
MGQVIIGMDPHKRSTTIEIINDGEKVLIKQMLAAALPASVVRQIHALSAADPDAASS